MADTSIEWSDKVWNPIGGCSKVSAGCKNCYAIDTAYNLVNRFKNAKKPNAGAIKYAGLTKVLTNGEKNWTGEVRFYENELIKPLKWKKPQRIFVNSMSDMFHEDVSFEDIVKIFAVMYASPQHTYMILTKRPDRMASVLRDEIFPINLKEKLLELSDMDSPDWHYYHTVDLNIQDKFEYPLKNVWLGVSVEDQKAADERIPALLGTPAAIRFLSCEPLLGEVWLDQLTLCNSPYYTYNCLNDIRTDLEDETTNAYEHNFYGGKIDWVIVGGESGKGARLMLGIWAHKIIKDCMLHNVPVFMKQFGSVLAKEAGYKDKKGGDINEWPFTFRVREFPEERGGKD